MNILSGLALSSSIALSGALLIKNLNAKETPIDEYKKRVSIMIDKIFICEDFYDKYLYYTDNKRILGCVNAVSNIPVTDVEDTLKTVFKKHIHCHNFYTKYSKELNCTNLVRCVGSFHKIHYV